MSSQGPSSSTRSPSPRTSDAPATDTPSELEALRFWLKLGCISFGGPAGQIAIMHDELVERRRWITERRFLHALNFCMAMPGPEAQQLATYIGYTLYGVRGAIASGGLGVHRGHPVTVVATTTLAELEQAAHAARDSSIPMPAPARTGGGSRLPMRDLIGMAANTIHYLAVFDDHTERPLYLGRQKRVATADQRLICYARDRGCTRPNCLEPGYRCEVHHSPEWARGGRTDADKLFFGCGGDHAMATRGELHTIVTDSGRLGWTDGTGPPEINHAHHPDELLRGDPDPPEDR